MQLDQVNGFDSLVSVTHTMQYNDNSCHTLHTYHYIPLLQEDAVPPAVEAAAPYLREGVPLPWARRGYAATPHAGMEHRMVECADNPSFCHIEPE